MSGLIAPKSFHNGSLMYPRPSAAGLTVWIESFVSRGLSGGYFTLSAHHGQKRIQWLQGVYRCSNPSLTRHAQDLP
jgi:hypothetical protein